MSRAWLKARNQHFEAIADHLRRMPAPKILVGDLNSTVWSPYFAETIGRTGMVDAREGFGLLPTWPTWLPVMKIPIDQCFVSPDVEIVNLKAGPHIGSDHLPLIIDLRLR
jgi:endonuclease/exonuclease/phosphatase (EEP) superfamily protein YafD